VGRLASVNSNGTGHRPDGYKISKNALKLHDERDRAANVGHLVIENALIRLV